MGGYVEINWGPDNNSVKGHLSNFHLTIRSVRNKCNAREDNGADYDIVCVTGTDLEVNMDTDDICISYLSKLFRADRASSDGCILFMYRIVFSPTE